MDKIEDTSSRKRVIVYVEKGQAYVNLDEGIEYELIDWDCIKDGSDGWTKERIDNLQKWGEGEGLVPANVIKRLREYAVEGKDE